MLQLIIMLLGLAFPNNTTTTFDGNQNTGLTIPGNGTDSDGSSGPGGSTSGNTGQVPPTIFPRP